MMDGAGPSTHANSPRRTGSAGTAASSLPPKSTPPSIVRRPLRRCGAGAMRHRAISYSPGRPPSSSRTGSGSATPYNSIELMCTRLKVLRQKAGPVLFQLPARFEADRDRLAQFIAMLPGKYRYAFEFRHESWYRPTVLHLLEDHNISLCLSDHHHAPAPWVVTAGHVYVRGHGPQWTVQRQLFR